MFFRADLEIFAAVGDKKAFQSFCGKTQQRRSLESETAAWNRKQKKNCKNFLCEKLNKSSLSSQRTGVALKFCRFYQSNDTADVAIVVAGAKVVVVIVVVVAVAS